MSGISEEGAEGRGFKRILVAVDGSEYSLKAAAVAARLSKSNGAQLHVVTVMGFPEYLILEGNVSPEVLTRVYAESKSRAEGVVQNVVNMAKSFGVEANGVVLTNARSIVQTITDFANERSIDLIVVGTRGMSGFKRALLGSVSSGIVSHASCSVLVVR
jgi:nucleotide-binding universal stress UspA family protein